MAYRVFRDSAGVEWEVWDTIPTSTVRHTLASGWLTFQCATAKRRLSPLPLYWVNASEEELTEMLERATPVMPRLG